VEYLRLTFFIQVFLGSLNIKTLTVKESLTNPHDAFLALRAGDENGLAFFFNLYYTPLVYFSTSVINNGPAAEDIASESFLKLWNKREEIEELAKIKNLLYNIVRNASIDYLRKQQTFHKYTKNFTNTDATQLNILDKLVDTEIHHHLYILLSQLPPRSRLIFELYFFQKKSLEEIALELGITLSAVKSQKHRALELLRKQKNALSPILLVLSVMLA
jgi:RNA polymerase sigma-70 factor (family 1)